jgi:hypothetical protein
VHGEWRGNRSAYRKAGMTLRRWWGVVVVVHGIIFTVVSLTFPLSKLELNRRFLRMSQRRKQDIGAGKGYQEVTKGLGDFLRDGIGRDCAVESVEDGKAGPRDEGSGESRARKRIIGNVFEDDSYSLESLVYPLIG